MVTSGNTQVENPQSENDDETPLQFQHCERTPEELAVVVSLRTAIIKKCRSGFLASVARTFSTSEAVPACESASTLSQIQMPSIV